MLGGSWRPWGPTNGTAALTQVHGGSTQLADGAHRRAQSGPLSSWLSWDKERQTQCQSHPGDCTHCLASVNTAGLCPLVFAGLVSLFAISPPPPPTPPYALSAHNAARRP